MSDITADQLIKKVGRKGLQAFIESLSNDEAAELIYRWEFWARPAQLAPKGTDWLTWLILAGRGFGKTRSGAEWVRSLVEGGKYGRIALVAEDAGDAREVMVEGESGLLAICPPWNRPKYEPSKKRVTWPNGARCTIYSSDDPETLRGPQHDAAWVDELCKMKNAQAVWDQLQFGLRLGKRPIQCITTTPRPIPLLHDLVKRPSTVIVTGSTYDNLANLAPTFREEITSRYEGTRLGRQELAAEILSDNPNALWTIDSIEKSRIKSEEVPQLQRIVVAVDPPSHGDETSDECGIIVAGMDVDPSRHFRDHYYILYDGSVGGRSPEGWAREVKRLYEEYMADAVVAETNQGGDMVESVIRQAIRSARVIQVKASRGKWTRAEPVASLYEQGRVHHVGQFPKLEDQMLGFDNSGLSEFNSPDRMDALVWGITQLMGKATGRKPKARRL